MAAKLDYDTDNRVIYVTEAPVLGEQTLNVKEDIYSDMKEDWKNNSTLNRFKFPLSEPVGGNTITGSKAISPYYFLKYGWRMRPYEGDHVLYLENGYLLVDGGGNPWNDTLGSYRVLVRDSVPADAYAVGSGAAPADPPTPAEIAAVVAPAVWDESEALIVRKMLENKVTKSGDIITIFDDDNVTPWRQYDLSDGGRVEV
jgi:hypothetical protein